MTKTSGFFLFRFTTTINLVELWPAVTSQVNNDEKQEKCKFSVLIKTQYYNSGDLVHADLIMTGLRDDPRCWDSLLRQKWIFNYLNNKYLVNNFSWHNQSWGFYEISNNQMSGKKIKCVTGLHCPSTTQHTAYMFAVHVHCQLFKLHLVVYLCWRKELRNKKS